MEWRGNRIHCLFLSLFLWETANGRGVWQNRPANYWQHGGDKDAGDKALALIQQQLSNTGSGIAANALAQPPSASSSGDSVVNAHGFLRQYTISRGQDDLNQLQPQGGYTAQLPGPSSDVVSSGVTFLTQSSTNQNQLVTRPVSPSQGSANQYLSSQQSQGSSSLPQSLSALYASGTQTQPSTSVSSSLSSGSDFTTTSRQASSGFQSAVGTTSSVSQSLPSQQSSMQFAFPSLGTSALQDLPPHYVPGTQAQPSSPVPSSLSSASGVATTTQQAVSSSQSSVGTQGRQPSSVSLGSQGSSLQALSGASSANPVLSQGSVGSYASPQTPSQPGIVLFKPVSSSLGSASGGIATTFQQASSGVQSAVGTTGSVSQQTSLQSAFPSLGTSLFVHGTQAQPSSPVSSSLSSASGAATTPQQASSGFQAAEGRQGSASQSTPPQQSSFQSAFPSLGSSPLPQGFPSRSVSGTQAQPQIGFATTSWQASPGFQAAAGGQASVIQSVAPQSGFQAPLPSLGTSALQDIPSRFVPETLAQPSSPLSSPPSLASGAAITSQQTSSGFQSAAGTQPSSSYFLSQGQRTQIPSGEASLSNASQQTSLQSAFPSLGSSLLPQGFPTLSVSGTLAQPPIGLGTTSQQVGSGFQAAAGAQGTLLSSLHFSSQGQSVASLYRPVLPAQALVSGYIAGPAQWYRIGPFGNRTLLPFQGSISQATSSNYASTSQSQSSPGSFGFATQSQSSPALAVGFTQGGGQLPSFQTSGGFSTTSSNAANPSASVLQPFQSTQSSGQSSSGQVPSVATQQ